MKNSSRRSFLKTATLIAGVAVVPVTFLSQEAFAAKVSKASMQYQYTPKSPNAHCSKCVHFQPGKTATDKGTCEVVEGVIDPNGWCLAFTPKA